MPHEMPVHSGMPTPIPSSEPLSLITVFAAEAFLANTPFAAQSVVDLTGGTVNYVYRIHLRTNFEGSQTVILKHAQPFTKNWTDTPWELERQMFEVEAMLRVGLCLPPTSLVKVPKIHHFDVHNNVIIMEDCGPDFVGLREFLSSSSASHEVAKTIGTAIGEFIAFLHEWSRSNPGGILNVFNKNLLAKKAVTELAYDRLVATLQNSDKYDLPLLSGLEVDQSDIETISKLTNGYRSHLISPQDPGHDVLLMGDFWHGNIVVSAQQTLRLFVLDWELARTGLPGSEIGLFCAAMEFLVRGNQVASGPASVLLQNFLDTYSRISTRDASLAQDTLSHWGGYYIFWAPRDPPGDRNLVQELVREGVKLLVHSRDTGFQAKSAVKGLVPRLTTA